MRNLLVHTLLLKMQVYADQLNRSTLSTVYLTVSETEQRCLYMTLDVARLLFLRRSGCVTCILIVSSCLEHYVIGLVRLSSCVYADNISVNT